MALMIVTWNGRRYTPAFRDALQEWQRLALLEGIPFRITQGGFNGTNVTASAGTHAGDAVDLSVWGCDERDVARLIEIGRMVGIACWFRTTKVAKWGTRAHGFSSYHIHGVPNLWGAPSDGARNQAHSYRRGRDGLASDQLDRGPGHVAIYRLRTWSGYLTAKQTVTLPTAPPLKIGELTVAEAKDILAELKAQRAELATIRANTSTAFGAFGERTYLEEVGRTTARHVWDGSFIGRDGGVVKTKQELADAKTIGARIEGKLGGLMVAMESLAREQGVDIAAVEDAAERGARAGTSEVITDLHETVEAIVPALREAVIETQGDIDPQHAAAFAEAVVDALKERL